MLYLGKVERLTLKCEAINKAEAVDKFIKAFDLDEYDRHLLVVDSIDSIKDAEEVI